MSRISLSTGSTICLSLPTRVSSWLAHVLCLSQYQLIIAPHISISTTLENCHHSLSTTYISFFTSLSISLLLRVNLIHSPCGLTHFPWHPLYFKIGLVSLHGLHFFVYTPLPSILTAQNDVVLFLISLIRLYKIKFNLK